MSTLAVVDTETTGLDPERHGIWEVALILDDTEDHSAPVEHHWFLPVDLGSADVIACNIGRLIERYPYVLRPHLNPTGALQNFAREFAQLTWGAHLVGAVPSFDAQRLERLLRANGACAGWHYHLIDVEALAVGFLTAKGQQVVLPWDTKALSAAVGVDPGAYRAHEAMEDARWARDVFLAVSG